MLLFHSVDDLVDPDTFPQPAIGWTFDVASDGIKEMANHSHKKAQVLYTTRGAVTVEVESGLWVAPPNCAVWIPGGIRHRSIGVGPLVAYGMFIQPEAAPGMPDECCIMSVSPLLHEMLMAFLNRRQPYPLGDTPEARFVAVLLDELAQAGRESLYLPMPADTRLRKLADLIIAEPSLRFTIEMWGEQIGVSPRTLSRLFVKETGLSFGKWRRQLQLSIALKWLAEGQTVTNTALDLGYENTSAFITMFKQAMGRTPSRYYERRGALAGAERS